MRVLAPKPEAVTAGGVAAKRTGAGSGLLTGVAYVATAGAGATVGAGSGAGAAAAGGGGGADAVSAGMVTDSAGAVRDAVAGAEDLLAGAEDALSDGASRGITTSGAGAWGRDLPDAAWAVIAMALSASTVIVVPRIVLLLVSKPGTQRPGFP
ncbi:MAG: hypothetical protein NVS9B10_17950 [Nevskia sp.]